MEQNNNIRQAYLSFRLNNELFAVSAFNVLEVLEKQNITHVPKAPDFVRGIINFRGEVLPVINTRTKFRMEELDENKKFVIIVFEIIHNEQTWQIGAIADGVKDVIELLPTDIKEVPKMGLNFNSDFIKGVVHQENGFIMLLNIEKVFSSSEIESLNLNNS